LYDSRVGESDKCNGFGLGSLLLTDSSDVGDTIECVESKEFCELGDLLDWSDKFSDEELTGDVFLNAMLGRLRETAGEEMRR
jgi:hypothetical protein